jgi:hypothetical protein
MTVIQTTPDESRLDFIRLPLRDTGPSLDPDSLMVGLTYLSCAFQVFLQPLDGPVRFEEDIDALSEFIKAGGTGTFLSWTQKLDLMDMEKSLPLATAIMKSVESSFGLLSPTNGMTLRLYALQCTAGVSSPTKLSWIWKHALNVAASYVKATTMSEMEEFSPLNDGLKSLMEALQSRKQHVILFNEESFNLLCREWSRLASRVKDSGSIQFIRSLQSRNVQGSEIAPEFDILDSISHQTQALETCLQSKDRKSH